MPTDEEVIILYGIVFLFLWRDERQGGNTYKKYNPHLCIECQIEIKQRRSEYCQKCYEREFEIREGEAE